MRKPPLFRESCPFDGITRPSGSRDIGSPGAPGGYRTARALGAPGALGVTWAGGQRAGPWGLADLGRVDKHVGLQRKPLRQPAVDLVGEVLRLVGAQLVVEGDPGGN